MEDVSKTILSGGNMSTPILENHRVLKDVTKATDTIHELLCYAWDRGFRKGPRSYGVKNGKHVLSYIEGFVPKEHPSWIWKESILKEAASMLRQWHEATLGFFYEGSTCLSNEEEHEVICHNDFAPYNCVFQKEHLVGLIDFDLCSKGARLWDIAYGVYRFVPLFPQGNKELYKEASPFSSEEMMERLQFFLGEYSQKDKELLYTKESTLKLVVKRVKSLASWSASYGKQVQNPSLEEDAKMYALHARWLEDFICEHFPRLLS